ncbi:NADPH:quinone reductase [Streptomyces sp. NPDC004609]|uniref:NADPH:quinone reductase n=1 Tax=Streptomyces sp. NPDC004609 TaxID=3364704 RepID=UPI0036C8198C
MRAAFIERFGPARDIRFGEVPAPSPGPTDVLVEVAATAVNPVDTFIRSGAWPTPVAFPFVLGRDLVGTAVSAGPGAAGFEPGDRVWCNSLGHGGRQGAAAQSAVVPVERLYRLPDSVCPVAAVAVLHPAATAYLALFTHGGVRAGETVLVAGAAGSVGAALVVLAAGAGARVVATARADDEEYCRSLGAAEFADYRAPDLPHRLRRLCPEGVDLLLDTSGRNDLDRAVDLLAFRGRIVLFAGLRARPALPVGHLYGKDGTVRGFVISRATAAELAEASRTVNRLLTDGLLRARAVEEMPLGEAARAHARLEAGGLRGTRLVLRPDADR